MEYPINKAEFIAEYEKFAGKEITDNVRKVWDVYIDIANDAYRKGYEDGVNSK